MFFNIKFFLTVIAVFFIFVMSCKNENLNKNPMWYLLTVGSLFVMAFCK